MPSVVDYPSVSQVSIVPIDTADYGPGVSYQVDTSFEAYRRQSTRHTTIPSQRESINLEGKTGEGTVNTEGLWRVNAPDWSYGAGQLYADREGSVANRFLASTGVDVFTTQYQATLIPATTQLYSNTDTATDVVSLGPYVFYATESEVLWRTSWSGSATSLTFTGSDFPTEVILGLMVDDYSLYIGTTLALYQCQVFAASTPGTAAKVVNQGCYPVGAAGGHVFVAGWGSQNTLYDVGQPTGVTNTDGTIINRLAVSGQGACALCIHPNPRWAWLGMALVDGTFYFTGIPQDNDDALIPNSQGEIWRTSYSQVSYSSVATQGVGLPAAQIALQLPPGEVCNTIFSYLNYCILGTTQGVRVCRTVSQNDPEGNTGDLIAGPLVPNLLQPVTGWVTGFTSQGRFVWFTWTGYDDSFIGGSVTADNSCVLGKLDMETMVDDLTPAYCSDRVYGQNGYMWQLCWDPITEGPLLSIDNEGLYGDNNLLYGVGILDSGLVTNNIPDQKIAAMLGYARDAVGDGSIEFSVQADGGGYASATPLAPVQPSSAPVLLSPLVRYEELNVQPTLLVEAGGATGPTLKRWTLKSIPAVVSGTTVSVVAMLYSKINSHGVTRAVDPYVELNYLETLRLSQQPVIYTEGDPNGTFYQATATIDSIDWLPEHERDTQQHGWDGVAVIYLKTIVG